MHVVTRQRDGQMMQGRAIENLDGLDNSDIVSIERGNPIKKALKKTCTVFGQKNLYSVKSLRDALTVAASKNPAPVAGHYCSVCGENWTSNLSGTCNECAI